MKKTKAEKGITLVALIITIVILIILAVVAITTIMNTDILGYADKSVNIYEKNKDNETETLQGYEDYLEGKGENDLGGELLKLIDVPVTETSDGTYSVENGVVKVNLYNPNVAGYYYDNYATIGVEIPCEYSLKKGVTYRLIVDRDSYNPGYYESYAWIVIDGYLCTTFTYNGSEGVKNSKIVVDYSSYGSISVEENLRFIIEEVD